MALCGNIVLKTIEFVHMKELFRKLPISTFDLINYYAEEVVTFELQTSNSILHNRKMKIAFHR